MIVQDAEPILRENLGQLFKVVSLITEIPVSLHIEFILFIPGSTSCFCHYELNYPYKIIGVQKVAEFDDIGQRDEENSGIA